MAFAFAQIAPMVLISGAFALRGSELAALTLGRVPIVVLLAASSIVVPLASQSFAGVVFASVGSTDRRNLPGMAAVFVRSLPQAGVLGAPVAVVLAVAVIATLGLDAEGASAYCAYLASNLVFALALTFAYVVNSPRIVVASWAAFSLSLALIPELWWAPAAAGAIVGFTAAGAIALGRTAKSPRPRWGASARGALRATIAGLPLWTIPLLVFVCSPVETPVGLVFLGMLPALLLYQVYFGFVARPLWLELDFFRHQLEGASLADGQDTADALRRSAARGWWVLGGGVAAGAALDAVLVAGGVGAPRILFSLSAATAAGVVLVVEATRHSMIAGDVPMRASAFVGPLAFAAGWWAVGDVTVALAAFAVACVVAAGIVAARNAVIWRDAAYYVFWRRAFEQ